MTKDKSGASYAVQFYLSFIIGHDRSFVIGHFQFGAGSQALEIPGKLNCRLIRIIREIRGAGLSVVGKERARKS